MSVKTTAAERLRPIAAIFGFGLAHSDFALDVQDIIFRCVFV